MSNINPDQVILGPVITEKTLAAQSRGVYSFWVTVHSTKYQVSKAFFSVFGIHPLSIRTVTTLGKVKTDPRKRTPIQKSSRKKAFITVGKDQKIELLNLNAK